jgi:hypothetical protein
MPSCFYGWFGIWKENMNAVLKATQNKTDVIIFRASQISKKR